MLETRQGAPRRGELGSASAICAGHAATADAQARGQPPAPAAAPRPGFAPRRPRPGRPDTRGAVGTHAATRRRKGAGSRAPRGPGRELAGSRAGTARQPSTRREGAPCGGAGNCAPDHGDGEATQLSARGAPGHDTPQVRSRSKGHSPSSTENCAPGHDDGEATGRRKQHSPRGARTRPPRTASAKAAARGTPGGRQAAGRDYAVAAAAALPALRPENMHPPRNVPSSERYPCIPPPPKPAASPAA